MPAGDFSFGAIGTAWKISLPGIGLAHAESVICAVRERIESFEQAYSRFRPDSFVGKMREKAGTYELPADAAPMLALYRALYGLTGGKMTPLIGRVLEDAGYDGAYSLVPQERIAPARKWDEVMEYDPPFLVAKEPISLDFGAVGKGYAVDIAAEAVRSQGIGEYTVNAGGDIAHRGPAEVPLRVGLEDPDDPAKAVGMAEITAGSICGSAGNRRAWGRFTHIIDPDSVASPRHIKALWVTAETAMVADALSTALFFVKPAALTGHFAFEWAIYRSDGSAETSPSFPGEFFGG